MKDFVPRVSAEAFPEALFHCPESGEPLRRQGDELVSVSGVGPRWPIVRGVPRFVASDQYLRSFSFEWNTHDRTQLDSDTGSDSSGRVFQQKTNLSAEQVRGRLVLDAGVGAGRFTDVLAGWGANVVGVDLSFAVEAARQNFKDLPNVRIAQGDIGKLPFAPGTFDFIVSIGVLHHTPDTRRYFEALVPLLKPGGEICIWVYPDAGDYLKRAAWIPFTRRLSPRWFYAWCRVFVPWAQAHPGHPLVEYAKRAMPFSAQGLGLENDILDTFDGYSPRYHGVHSPAEVKAWFERAGLENVRVLAWDTAVRGRRPEA